MTDTTQGATPQETRDVLEILRRREIQMMGAAISTRSWHDMEAAYNAGRDRLDALLITIDRARSRLPLPNEGVEIARIVGWIEEAIARAKKHGGTEGVWLFASQWAAVRACLAPSPRSRQGVREEAAARAALTEIVRLNGGADWRGTRGIALEALGLAAPNDERGTGFAVDALTAAGDREPPAEEVAGGEVTQADRDFAAGWIVINLEDAKLIRAGLWDGHPGVVAAMKHRLSEAGL